MVRIGFLGAGLIAHFHALGLAGAKAAGGPGAAHTLAGVFDPDPDRRAEFAAGWGATVCDSEEEVLDGCDAVYVCTWTSEHARLVDAACERGLAVFCEKPLAFDAPAAAAMAERVAEAGVINQVGLVLRSSPAFALLTALASDPDAGRVMSVVFRDDQYIPTQGMYASDWRGDRTRAGAGTLLEHAIHDLDILEHSFGAVASVSGQSANFHGLDGIEDSVATSFRLESGAVGVHTTIWHDIMERPSLRRVEVFCERRHIVLENDHLGPITWTTNGSEAETVEGDALIEAAADRGISPVNPDGSFVAAVASGSTASPTFADALRAHRLVDAIYRSASDGGRSVTIDR